MDLIRTGHDISVGRWKTLLVAFALLSITVMGIEGVSAVAAFERGVELSGGAGAPHGTFIQ